MKHYTHNNGETITQSDIEAPLRAELNRLIDGDGALHNIIYNVIDGTSLFAEGVRSAFAAMENAAANNPKFAAITGPEVISNAVFYAKYNILQRSMFFARGLA